LQIFTVLKKKSFMGLAIYTHVPRMQVGAEVLS
jgi:hypothetical protein